MPFPTDLHLSPLNPSPVQILMGTWGFFREAGGRKAPATRLSLSPSSSATLGVQTCAATSCFILDTFEEDFYFPQGQALKFLN